jgi:hypothetical protein
VKTIGGHAKEKSMLIKHEKLTARKVICKFTTQLVGERDIDDR